MNKNKKNEYNILIKDLNEIKDIQYNIHNILYEDTNKLDNIQDNISTSSDLITNSLKELYITKQLKHKKNSIIIGSVLGFLCLGPLGGIVTGLNTGLTSGIISGLICGFISEKI